MIFLHHSAALLKVSKQIILSPCLFAIFIDSMINKLRAAGYGAFIGQFYFGCLLYADNIILVCHSITTMQLMLDICFIVFLMLCTLGPRMLVRRLSVYS